MSVGESSVVGARAGGRGRTIERAREREGETSNRSDLHFFSPTLCNGRMAVSSSRLALEGDNHKTAVYTMDDTKGARTRTAHTTWMEEGRTDGRDGDVGLIGGMDGRTYAGMCAGWISSRHPKNGSDSDIGTVGGEMKYCYQTGNEWRGPKHNRKCSQTTSLSLSLAHLSNCRPIYLFRKHVCNVQSPRKRYLRCGEKFLPGPDWLLLSKTCIPFQGPPYIVGSTRRVSPRT